MAIRDLSGLARIAIFRAIHKLHEYYPCLSLSSSSMGATYALSAFSGRAPALLDLLHDVVKRLEGIDIYDHDKAEHLVGGM